MNFRPVVLFVGIFGIGACANDRAQVGGADASDSAELSAQGPSATLCTGTNYGGTCETLPLGSFNYAQMVKAGVANDSVKSVKLSAGAALWAYHDANYAGTQWIITGDTADLGAIGASAQISSLVVGPNPNNYFNLIYPNGSMCLDVNGGSSVDGTNIQVWTCNNRASQAFRFSQVTPGVFNVVHQGSQKCMDVLDASSANLANIQLYDCKNNDLAEQFAFVNATTAGSFGLGIPATGKCLDVYASGKTPGTNVDQYTCGGGASQTWQLTIATVAAPTPTPTVHPTPTPTPTPTPLPAIVLQDGNYIDIETSQLLHPHQYDYAPSVIFDGSIYHMWWCAGLAGKPGDHILYAEASSAQGPWHAHGSTSPNTWDDVFDATYSTADYDGQDTCDPSVVQVNGTYYLYYGGLTISTSSLPVTTMIGVATSKDGLSWTRHSKEPIVVSAAVTNRAYGAGQPSVLYKDGLFYMMYTDTTNPAGDGIYLLRSPDPFFASQVEEYSSAGFVPQKDAKVAHNPFRKGTVDVDWTYSDPLHIFVVAANGIPNRTVLYIYDENLNAVGPVQWEDGSTMDGPGLVVDARRHALQGATCQVMPLGIVREIADGSQDTAPYNGDLAFESATLRATNRTCP